MFEIVTDSGANLPIEMIEEDNIYVLPFGYSIDSKLYNDYLYDDIAYTRKFYDQMRKKKLVTMNDIDPQIVYDVVDPLLKDGKDIIYVGLSSGLSESYRIVFSVLKTLKKKYPDNKIYAIDSLSASLGEGLLVMSILDMREEGWPIEETYKWALDNRRLICNEFVIDSNYHIRKNPNVSGSFQNANSFVKNRHYMYLDKKGKLCPVSNYRSRRKSLDQLIERFDGYALDPEYQQICICHADCEEDAKYLSKKIEEKYGVKDIMIKMMEPVMGARLGPGSIGLYFVGEHRYHKNVKQDMKHIFIVNPEAGKNTFADSIRKQLDSISDLNYYLFSTRSAGHETKLVRELVDMFEGEKIRFYVCGGTGTFRNVMNAFYDFSDVELAFFPSGLSNDFLKAFGESAKRFENIEELIFGEVAKVDYIKTNHGVGLNTISVGIDSAMNELVKKFKNPAYLMSNIGIYVVSILWSFLTGRTTKLDVLIDDFSIEGDFSEIVFCNGICLGGCLYFDTETCVTDGIGTFISSEKKRISLFRRLFYLYKKDIKRLSALENLTNWRKGKIVSKDGRPIVVNMDGEMIEGYSEWEFEIVPKGLNFVVPKGVRL